MILSAILAVSENGVIGSDNRLPWHIPEDLKFFKAKTVNHKVIMGRKTFESLGGKPLPKRTNIVLSRQTLQLPEGVLSFLSLEACFKFLNAKTAEDEEVFVIGGAEIYKTFEEHLHRYYITRIHEKFEGDSRFEGPDLELFQMVESRASEQAVPQPLQFEFEIWNRRDI